MILSNGPNKRVPPPSLAATIFAKTGFKFGIFEGLSDDDAQVAARIHGATPTAEPDAQEAAA